MVPKSSGLLSAGLPLETGKCDEEEISSLRTFMETKYEGNFFHSLVVVLQVPIRTLKRMAFQCSVYIAFFFLLFSSKGLKVFFFQSTTLINSL